MISKSSRSSPASDHLIAARSGSVALKAATRAVPCSLWLNTNEPEADTTAAGSSTSVTVTATVRRAVPPRLSVASTVT